MTPRYRMPKYCAIERYDHLIKSHNRGDDDYLMIKSRYKTTYASLAKEWFRLIILSILN